MCAMPTTLLIPGFLRAHQAAGRPRLPALERMLARATQVETRHTEACLASLFGLAAGDIQPGPFMRLADGGRPDEGYWLRADPVHLAPDRDQLVLMPLSVLAVQHVEMQALAMAFDATYGTDGWHLEFPHPEHGYLRAPQVLEAATHDPESFVGGPVLEAMPSGQDGTRLKQLMNEIQMLFHTHAVNTAREEAGRPFINSLWLWGGGVLPAATAKAPSRLLTDLPMLRGLAAWAEQAPVAPSTAAHLVAGDLIGLAADDMQALERDWFAPLLKIMKGSALGTLDIHLGGLGDFRLEPGDVRRFWRLSRPVGAAS
jgi:hypothetical protein